MADLHLSFWEELEKLTQEHTLCYSISGQGFVGEETRSTNEATAMEKAAGDVEEADEQADEADGAADVGTCYDAAAQY